MRQAERRLELFAVHRLAQHAVRAGGRDVLQRRPRSARSSTKMQRGAVPQRQLAGEVERRAAASRSGSVSTSSCGGRWAASATPSAIDRAATRLDAHAIERFLEVARRTGIAVDDERAARARRRAPASRGLARRARRRWASGVRSVSVMLVLRSSYWPGCSEGLHRKQHAERRARARGADDVDAAAGLRRRCCAPSADRCRCRGPGPWW